jgi:hypothetical protein
MKRILISLLFCQSLWASPISSNDVKKQKNLELLKRTITAEMIMTVDKMIAIIERNNLDYEHKNNTINIEINGYRMIIVYDLKADRMRIISPIVKVSDLKEGQMQQALDANFHTALDARYAISDGVVWSVFVHPLSDLSEKLFQSALEQTLVAAATFGKEYSSGAFSFPKALLNEKETKVPQENK